MSETEQTPRKPAPVKRKLSEVPFRGWAVQIQDQSIDVTPTHADIARAVEYTKAGNSELRSFSDEPQKLAHEIAEQAKGSREQFIELTKEYHAAQVAYLVVNGWGDYPIEVMANGDMRDGQHRWLAANFLEMGEVDITVIVQ